MSARSQQVWDDLEVIDGPNPTLRFGFYTETSGKVEMGRYFFVDDGKHLRVRLAPYGRTPVELPVRNYNRTTGELLLGWEGKPDRTCLLERQNDQLFLGNCTEKLSVLPISIRVFNERDDEWMGAHFPVSSEDVEILEKAIGILEKQGRRNRMGDRNCDDDLTNENFSVFCALYSASIQVSGTYRHRRPAMQAVRNEALRRYPGQYLHRLRDINNRADIADQALIETLETVRDQLSMKLTSERQEE